MRMIAIFLGLLIAAAALCHSEDPSSHRVIPEGPYQQAVLSFRDGVQALVMDQTRVGYLHQFECELTQVAICYLHRLVSER